MLMFRSKIFRKNRRRSQQPELLSVTVGQPSSSSLLPSPPYPVECQMDLCTAASVNNVDAVLDLIRSGVDLNYTNKNGWYPLMYACCAGNLKVVDLLLMAGAAPSIPKWPVNDKTPIMLAAASGHNSIVDMILKYYHSAYKALDTKGRGAIHYATLYNHPEVVSNLTGYGADPGLCDLNGNNCLHIACEGGLEELVDFFLEFGVDPLVENLAGQTALNVAELNCCFKISKLIRKHLHQNQTSQFPIFSPLRASRIDHKENSRYQQDEQVTTDYSYSESEIENDSQDRLFEFLSENNLVRYYNVLKGQNITFESLFHLDENDLRTVGIDKIGSRKRLIMAIEKYLVPSRNCPSPNFVPKKIKKSGEKLILREHGSVMMPNNQDSLLHEERVASGALKKALFRTAKAANKSRAVATQALEDLRTLTENGARCEHIRARMEADMTDILSAQNDQMLVLATQGIDPTTLIT